MNVEKQIEETAEEILQEFTSCYSEADEDCLMKMLRNLVKKCESEGEWIYNKHYDRVCSVCGKEPLYKANIGSVAVTFRKAKSKFCPHCGVKIKGGE